MNVQRSEAAAGAPMSDAAKRRRLRARLVQEHIAKITQEAAAEEEAVQEEVRLHPEARVEVVEARGGRTCRIVSDTPSGHSAGRLKLVTGFERLEEDSGELERKQNPVEPKKMQQRPVVPNARVQRSVEPKKMQRPVDPKAGVQRSVDPKARVQRSVDPKARVQRSVDPKAGVQRSVDPIMARGQRSVDHNKMQTSVESKARVRKPVELHGIPSLSPTETTTQKRTSNVQETEVSSETTPQSLIESQQRKSPQDPKKFYHSRRRQSSEQLKKQVKGATGGKALKAPPLARKGEDELSGSSGRRAQQNKFLKVLRM